VVEVTRAHGADLISGRGLVEALEGVDVVIDVSNPMPADDYTDISDTLATASRNLVGACAHREVQRLVVLTIAGMEDPTLDEFPYYVDKRAAKEILLDGPVPVTLVKSTQWHEFATNPAAVSCSDGEVVVEDWLIQPIAADSVADVLVEAALGQIRTPRTITGPQDIRLPELTSKLLALHGDGRRVRAVQPVLPGLAGGALLAPTHAMVLGPDVDTWLDTLAKDGAASSPTAEASKDLSHT
jgi:uncharacterized protein YbjT (DUF2867 family)